MKFQCMNPECGKTFYHAAKRTENNHFFPKPADLTVPPILENQIERYVCPYCLSLDFEEYLEPLPKLVSVLSVDLADVDAKLKEGYEVKELYARSAVMIKKETKPNAP